MTPSEQCSWLEPLRANPLPWLLGKGNPCVRYRTLTELLDRPPDDPEVVQARDAAWQWPPARQMLASLARYPHIAPGTPFREKEPPHELDGVFRFGLPPGHPAIDHACEQFLRARFTVRPSCYPEQVTGGLVRYARLDDARLRKKIRFVVRNQPFADGNRPGVLRYGSRGSCCGSHSCFSAVARALWAVAGVPSDKRTREVRRFLRRGAAFLAAHRVYQPSHRPGKPIRKDWLALHQPWALAWRTDLLDLLDVATQVGLADDPSLADALRFVLSKQNGRGRWALEEHYRNRLAILSPKVDTLETVGQESKWITLTALLQLKRCQKLVVRLCRGEEIEAPPPPRRARFFGHPFPYERADEARVWAEWESLGLSPVLAKLVRFAEANGLETGWHWGFVMGPKHCREWCFARVRWVPRKSDKQSWPVSRVFFLARRGLFTLEALSERLGIPVEDEHEEARFHKFFWRSLWRIRTAKWKDGLDEIAVTLRAPEEFTRLRTVMARALRSLANGG